MGLWYSESLGEKFETLVIFEVFYYLVLIIFSISQLGIEVCA